MAARQYSKMSGAPLQEAYTAILPIQTAVRRGTNSGGSAAGSRGVVANISMPSGKVTLASATGSTKGAHTSS